MDWNEFVNTFPIQLNQQQQEAVQSLSLIHIQMCIRDRIVIGLGAFLKKHYVQEEKNEG